MGPVVKRTSTATEGELFAIESAPDDAMANDGESVAMRCLRDAVQASGIPQKVLCGKRSLQQFNKLLNGVQAFPVAVLDELPAEVRDDFLARYAAAQGRVYRVPTREEELEAMAAQLADATRIIRDLTAAHLRRQMRGR